MFLHGVTMRMLSKEWLDIFFVVVAFYGRYDRITVNPHPIVVSEGVICLDCLHFSIAVSLHPMYTWGR